jgi:hypothetical protein
MSNELIEKMRKARQQGIEVDGLQFTIKRPTDLDVMEIRRKGINQYALLRGYVVDWSGVQERHLINGGTPKPIEFDSDVFMEWVSDQPTVFSTLIEAISKSYQDHEQEREDALKKPDTGSN